MTPILRLAPRLALVLSLAVLSGCGTFGALNNASRNLDAYELRPLPPQGDGQGQVRVGGRMVFVAEPSVTGALGSERIVVKPGALQVAFLPDGRWVEPTSVHIRNLIARSLANSGSLGLVSTNNVGPLPDFTLMTDVETFEAQVGAGGAPARVVATLTISIARDADGRLVAARRFSRSADATSLDAPDIVAAFNSAMSALLRDSTAWAVGVMAGTPRA